MKKFLNLPLLFLMLLFMYACDNNDNPAEESSSMEFSSMHVVFNQNSESVKVNVNSDDWYISEIRAGETVQTLQRETQGSEYEITVDWLQVSRQGRTIDIDIVKSNMTREARTFEIVIRAFTGEETKITGEEKAPLEYGEENE